MKHIILLSVGFAALFPAFYFYQDQKAHFNKTIGAYHDFRRELKAVEDNVVFLKEHQSEFSFLMKKEWFNSQSRLVCGESIHPWATSLNALRFKIEPETIKEVEGKYTFNVSKIIMEIDALFDSHIYDLAKNTLKNFPGMLMLRKLSIRRNENMNAPHQFVSEPNKRPNLVVGELIFEWCSMEERRMENEYVVRRFGVPSLNAFAGMTSFERQIDNFKTNRFWQRVPITLFFFLFIAPRESHASLFFTAQEIRLIHRNFLLKNKSVTTQANLYLSSILYVDEAHWSLWVNNQVIHSTDPHSIHGFYIEKVTPFTAEFSYRPPQSTVLRRFTLRSQEIFLRNEKKIIKFLKINEK